MTTDPTLSTRLQILEAAQRCFMTYGFKRASMQAIADMADVSRTAVYLYFGSKEEVFRALVTLLFERFHTAAEAALTKVHLPERLFGMLSAKLETLLDAAASPHGEELFGLQHRLCADISATGHQKFTNLIRTALTMAGEEIDPARLGLDIAGAADLLLAWTYGIGQKATGEGARALARQQLQDSVTLFCAALVRAN